MIKAGEKLPEGTLKTLEDGQVIELTTTQIFSKKLNGGSRAPRGFLKMDEETEDCLGMVS